MNKPPYGASEEIIDFVRSDKFDSVYIDKDVSGRNKQIFKSICLDKKTFTELASYYSLSPPRIRLLFKRFIARVSKIAK